MIFNPFSVAIPRIKVLKIISNVSINVNSTVHISSRLKRISNFVERSCPTISQRQSCKITPSACPCSKNTLHALCLIRPLIIEHAGNLRVVTFQIGKIISVDVAHTLPLDHKHFEKKLQCIIHFLGYFQRHFFYLSAIPRQTFEQKLIFIFK